MCIPVGLYQICLLASCRTGFVSLADVSAEFLLLGSMVFFVMGR